MSPLFRNIFFGILGLIFAGYFLFQLRGFFFNTALLLQSPANGAHFYSSEVLVKGRVVDVARLSVNGRRIFADEKGNFEEELLLPYGLNTVSVEAQGKFGKTYREDRIIYVTGREVESD